MQAANHARTGSAVERFAPIAIQSQAQELVAPPKLAEDAALIVMDKGSDAEDTRDFCSIDLHN